MAQPQGLYCRVEKAAMSRYTQSPRCAPELGNMMHKQAQFELVGRLRQVLDTDFLFYVGEISHSIKQCIVCVARGAPQPCLFRLAPPVHATASHARMMRETRYETGKPDSVTAMPARVLRSSFSWRTGGWHHVESHVMAVAGLVYIEAA